MNCLFTSGPANEKNRTQFPSFRILLALVIAGFASPFVPAQNSSSPQQSAIIIEGTIRNSAGDPVGGATVSLEKNDHSKTLEATTNEDGTFSFMALGAGVYRIKAEKPGWGTAIADSLSVSQGEKKRISLVLGTASSTGDPSSSGLAASQSLQTAMQYADETGFTVAGITDWNNVGLHASATDARTSEALARDTRALESGGAAANSAGNSPRMAIDSNEQETGKKLQAALIQAPKSFEANHQLGELYCRSKRYKEAIPFLEAASQIDSGNLSNSYDLALAYLGNEQMDRAREQGRKMLLEADSAEAHRLVGDLEERMGDPLGAVREYEQATRLDASEQNYFEWGTELLLHRAAQPAIEVFSKGFSAHPDSARLLTGLGAALYASGSYDEAARRLCQASDLRPADPEPYLFLGKMEKASPATLPCGEEKLARFVAQQPENALANYYYGLILWKQSKGAENADVLDRARIHLQKAVDLDPKLDEAYLQLGILHAGRGEFAQAVVAYQKAIEVNPRLGEAHYRLALAYKRVGEESKAQQEMTTYKEIEKVDAEALERQERDLRQFLIILKNPPAGSGPH